MNKLFCGNMNGSDHLEDLRVYRSIIWKLSLEKLTGEWILDLLSRGLGNKD
jgi:hypothetical protein